MVQLGKRLERLPAASSQLSKRWASPLGSSIGPNTSACAAAGGPGCGESSSLCGVNAAERLRNPAASQTTWAAQSGTGFFQANSFPRWNLTKSDTNL